MKIIQTPGGDFTQKVEARLKQLRFHPDFLRERNEEVINLTREFIESGGKREEIHKLRGQGHVEASRLWQACSEYALIKDTYPARVRFLSELLKYIGGVTKDRPKVADDGCGGGVDLFCLTHILGDAVELVGVDPDGFALNVARDRNPGLELRESLGDAGKFDLVYCDFVDWGRGRMTEYDVDGKRDEWSAALAEGGLLIQNVDFPDWQRETYKDIISTSFNPLRDELIQTIPEFEDCHLIVFEKK